MKTVAELRTKLRRQWENPTLREARLLRASDDWPIVLSIGRPSTRALREELDAVKQHVESWRQLKTGKITWESIQYRATATPVELPVAWVLSKPSEWIEAAQDMAMRREFLTLSALVEQCDPIYHSLFVRRRSLWLGKPLAEIVQAVRVAMVLTPRCAAGRPLRTLGIEGIDTKFFERHAQLMTTLLDVRFDGEASRLGLENYLDAYQDGDHWLLVQDLDGSLLPFRQIRVRSSELREKSLPGTRVLIIENESCQHLLPKAQDTIAVLGTGFNLTWLEGAWLTERKIAYWGDIDTWGLHCLARARSRLPQLEVLMMTSHVYDQFSNSTVCEPINAGMELPSGLNDSEQQLYRRLLKEKKARLEQEFLSVEFCRSEIERWVFNS
jgi:hypothetical protein